MNSCIEIRLCICIFVDTNVYMYVCMYLFAWQSSVAVR